MPSHKRIMFYINFPPRIAFTAAQFTELENSQHPYCNFNNGIRMTMD